MLKPSGGTAIYDALADTSRLFEQRVNLRAAMIVVSDGADTASDRSLLQTIEVVRRNDAFVYAIAIDAPDGRESTRVNPDALRDITGLTGGYTEVVRERRRSRSGHGAHRRRIEQAVHDRLQLVEAAGRRLAAASRSRPHRWIFRPRPPRILRPSPPADTIPS